jgi:hypothetical protein
MSNLLRLPNILLLRHPLLRFLHLLPLQLIRPVPRKHPPSQPLYVQRGLVAPLFPHIRVEVEAGLDDPVGAFVDEKALHLHLDALLAGHLARFRALLVCLGLNSSTQLPSG